MPRCTASCFFVLIVGAISANVVNAATVELLIDPRFGSTENTGAAARLLLEFTTVGLEDRLSVTIENTTPPEIGAFVTAVGLELPEAFGKEPTWAPGGQSAYFTYLLFDVSFPPPWLNATGGYDMVISGDPSFLGQSPTGAPASGESQTVVLNLGHTGHSADTLAHIARSFYADESLTLIVGRFQTVGSNGEDSDKVRGGIPEPTTCLLLACGMLACGRRLRHGAHAAIRPFRV